MTRPLEVGQAGLLAMLLLSASGCAGLPQRTSGTAPQSAPADGQPVSPPGLFSWWHRGSSRNVGEQTASVYHPESAGRDRAAPLPVDISERAQHAAAQPRSNPAIERQDVPQQMEPDSAVDRTSSQRPALDDILPASALVGQQESLRSGPGSKGPARSTDAAVSNLVLDPQPAPPPAEETRMAQGPPPPAQRTAPAPPPPAQQTAPAPPPGQRPQTAPSPAGGDRPAASPLEPPSPAAAPPAEEAKPAAGTPTSPPAAAPAPVPATGQAQAPAYVSSQRTLVASNQTPYSSPFHMTHPQPRPHLLSGFFHNNDDDDNRPLASSQLPAATFPGAYTAPQSALPTQQGNAAACETAGKEPKKPCFLKVWIRDLKHGHRSDGGDCGHGGVCASAQANARLCETAKAPKKPCCLKVWIHNLKDGGKCSHGDGCGQGGVTPGPQTPAVCETTVKAPKKPCFLKVWIHDRKSGHGSGCGSCRKGGGSCSQTCQCGGGGGSPVSASAQGNIASAQATVQVYTRP
jgi:hypothetical protein